MASTAPSPEPSPSPSPDPSLGNPSSSSLLEAVDKLKFFLATAPSTFPASPSPPPPDEDRALNRFLLPTGELISCVLWNGLYHITGTDIVRALNFRFLAFGRPVRNTKKFEEGVFSDLRNLKSGTDATLEEPKSEFLELLFKHNCIRTQKKQKVFYWFSVPHDRLFLDALDRDLKREKLGQESTTEAVREPALSFRWNPNKSLFDQFTTAAIDAPAHVIERREEEGGQPAAPEEHQSRTFPLPAASDALPPPHLPPTSFDQPSRSIAANGRRSDEAGSNVFGALALFEGSPAYKQRRRPLIRKRGGSYARSEDARTFTAEQALEAPDRDASLYPGGARSLGGLSRVRLSSFTEGSPQGPHIELTSSYLRGPLDAMVDHQVAFERQAESVNPLGSSSSTSTPHHDSHPPLDRDLQPRIAIAHSFVPPASTTVSGSPSAEQLGSLKTYVCPLFSCGRLFKRLEHLKRHVRTHTSEKPFACPTCGKTFARTDNLGAHIKVHEKAGSHQPTNAEVVRGMELDEDGATEGSTQSHRDFSNPHSSTSMSSPIASAPPASRPSEVFDVGAHHARIAAPSPRLLESAPPPNPPPPNPPPLPPRRHRSTTPAACVTKDGLSGPSALEGLHRHSATGFINLSISRPFPSSSSASPSFTTHINTINALHGTSEPQYSTALYRTHGWRAEASAGAGARSIAESDLFDGGREGDRDRSLASCAGDAGLQ